MEVKHGYKQTELGIIPEEWNIIKLGDILEFKNGLNKEKKYFGYGTPIVNYMDVFNFRGIHSKYIHGKVFLSSSEIKTYQAKKGDIFFTRTSETVDEIGISSVLLDDSQDTVFSGFVLRGREKHNYLNNNFKKYCFSEVNVRSQIKSTASYTTRALTNGRLLSQVLIKVPPHPEQTAIANALSDMDALISQTEKLIEKKKAIKQGAMQELLKPKEGWVTKKLGDIGIISGAGVDKKTNANETPVRLLNYMDVYKRDFIYSNELNHRVTAPGNKIINCSVKQGDVFFTPSSETRTDIGLAAVAMEDINDAVYSYHVMRFRLLIDWDLKFKTYIFQTKSFLDQTEKMCEGGGKRYVLTMPKFRALLITYPNCIIEQQEISEKLWDMDQQLNLLSNKLTKLKHQKQGMMQALLTGKIRLV